MMTERAETPTWVPPLGWWLLLVCVIGTGIIGNWFMALGVLVFLLIQAFRPFDFITSMLVVTAGATFVGYEAGNLTLQLSLLTCAIVVMLVSYAITSGSRRLSLPWSSLSLPLLAYILLSVVNAARGVLMGYPPKSIMFEILPVLAIATTFLVANGFEPKRDMRLVVVSLVGIAFGSASMGYYVFSIIHTHTAGVYFNMIPGVAALLFVNLALRSKRVAEAAMWMLLSLPLYLHQFLSFRRGLWVGGITGLIASLLIFAWRGTRAQWARAGLLVGILAAVGLAGAMSLEVFYGQTDILRESVARFASIGDTRANKMETRSNLIRLAETAGVLDMIRKSPVVGRGLGFTFFVRIPLQGRTRPQWWMDENYLLIWLKQGLIGVLLYLWFLWTAFRFGVRYARGREDLWESAWFATTAATTVFMVMFSISDWPFGQVGPTFLLALIYGVSIAMAREGVVWFRWSPSGSRVASDSYRLPPAPDSGAPERP